MRILFLGFLIFLCPQYPLTAQNAALYINEILADNSTGIQDEFDEFPDWIELFNSGTASINLEGYSLSDDPNDSLKWVFPKLLLSPGQYLHVFASGKDIFNPPLIWSTVIDRGDEWKYLVPDASTPSTWQSTSYTDTDWNSGISGFGFGDNDDSTLIDKGSISVYLRTTFSIENLAAIEQGILHIDYDDAFVAYLNGTEVSRDNLGTPGTEVAFDQPATNSAHEAKIFSGGKPDIFFIEEIKNLLVEGVNVLAIAVHNASATSTDLTAIPFLTLGYSSFDASPYTNSVLQLPEFSIHTNFKLSSGGEYLGLYDPAGKVIDSLTFDAQQTDISFGRSVSDPANWEYFDDPTPGAINIPISQPFIDKPKFSIQGGFYDNPQTLVIAIDPSLQVYYTIDGTIPDQNSTLYAAPISLDATSAIRAIAFENGETPSDVVTQTYFINEDINLPFISLVTNPDHLFSDESGIYVTGTNGVRGSCDPTIRNLNQDWERPVNLEMYNTTGELILNQVAGIKIFGGCSRTRYPQKSFSLFARSKYGKGSFNAQLFPDKEIYKFESFILRSSADDQTKTMFKDAFANYVQLDYMDTDYQAYRPTVVFINGVYWGIHNMREKVNEHYLAENYDVDPNEVNILQGNKSPSYGSNVGYQEMIDFAANGNLSERKSYEYMQSKMDIDQYIDYQIANIYLAEVDWPGNNIKFWNSSNHKHNKWRWITFDRDQTFLPHRIETNALALATATNATGWPNPPWSTLLFRRLLTNDDFRNKFIQLYAYHLNMTFGVARIHEYVDVFKSKIENEIPRHIEKWGGKVDPDMNESWTAGPTFNSVPVWEGYVADIKAFAEQRPKFAIQYLQSNFGLAAMVPLKIDLNNDEAGIVKIHHKEIPKEGYSGDHFINIPIVFKAISKNGYQFSHWTISTTEGEISNENVIIEISLPGATSITAHFKENINGETPSVIINEINYNSHDDSNSGDWVEIYNNSAEIIDLKNWFLTDEDDLHIFKVTDDLELNPGDFIVLCESVTDFKSVNPLVANLTGDLGFKFSNDGEVIKLYSENNILIDSVHYNDKNPWPESPDGTGATLELLHPDLDNDEPENWTASGQGGSPGRSNLTITNLTENPENSIDQFKLLDNFPNPGNNTTTISYSLGKSGKVSLKCINVMGDEVAVLVDDIQSEGFYEVDLNVRNLPNGVYLYYLLVNNMLIDSKRLLVDH